MRKIVGSAWCRERERESGRQGIAVNFSQLIFVHYMEVFLLVGH